jgi:hypothetical protein
MVGRSLCEEMAKLNKMLIKVREYIFDPTMVGRSLCEEMAKLNKMLIKVREYIFNPTMVGRSLCKEMAKLNKMLIKVREYILIYDGGQVLLRGDGQAQQDAHQGRPVQQMYSLTLNSLVHSCSYYGQLSDT